MRLWVEKCPDKHHEWTVFKNTKNVQSQIFLRRVLCYCSSICISYFCCRQIDADIFFRKLHTTAPIRSILTCVAAALS